MKLTDVHSIQWSHSSIPEYTHCIHDYTELHTTQSMQSCITKITVKDGSCKVKSNSKGNVRLQHTAYHCVQYVPQMSEIAACKILCSPCAGSHSTQIFQCTILLCFQLYPITLWETRSPSLHMNHFYRDSILFLVGLWSDAKAKVATVSSSYFYFS